MRQYRLQISNDNKQGAIYWDKNKEPLSSNTTEQLNKVVTPDEIEINNKLSISLIISELKKHMDSDQNLKPYYTKKYNIISNENEFMVLVLDVRTHNNNEIFLYVDGVPVMEIAHVDEESVDESNKISLAKMNRLFIVRKNVDEVCEGFNKSSSIKFKNKATPSKNKDYKDIICNQMILE
ncbi:MAG: hypothetical protein IKP24_01820 [Alphaproteobacteria bacterium]|nr:hypothetical protein [Alphaproteobacteria bacterium]